MFLIRCKYNRYFTLAIFKFCVSFLLFLQYHIFLKMKKFGSILRFSSERNEDLMRAYNYHINRVRRIFLPDIYELVANSPAKRFWVSEERAAVVISRMLAHKSLPRMRPNKLEMFQEIFRRYHIERGLHPTLAFPAIISIVVNQPAPKFYLTPRTVGEYIQRFKSHCYEKCSKTY